MAWTATKARTISPRSKNIMNEYYAKDISKKRRIVNKMKGNAGVPLSPPPYGYIKNPDDPRFWVVEPEAAEVVRRIYRMALEGYGLAETAATALPPMVWSIPPTTGAAVGQAGAGRKAPWSLPNGDTPPSRRSSPCRNTAAMSSTSKATPSPTR